ICAGVTASPDKLGHLHPQPACKRLDVFFQGKNVGVGLVVIPDLEDFDAFEFPQFLGHVVRPGYRARPATRDYSNPVGDGDLFDHRAFPAASTAKITRDSWPSWVPKRRVPVQNRAV